MGRYVDGQHKSQSKNKYINTRIYFRTNNALNSNSSELENVLNSNSSELKPASLPFGQQIDKLFLKMMQCIELKIDRLV